MVGVGKKPWNLTRQTNPADPLTRPPVSIYTKGYGYGYFKYPENGFWNFGPVDTRPPDNI
jgi:hypothetical protein